MPRIIELAAECVCALYERASVPDVSASETDRCSGDGDGGLGMVVEGEQFRFSNSSLDGPSTPSFEPIAIVWEMWGVHFNFRKS